ncbi:ArsR/SmtB family transcription factor [Dongia deserti]|uniref:ArsR/SmtB family transcription factor n=1 Tax=Dongia deserti TaxID=2268030 RepID=UPI0025498D35|nr:winged helix-turn-helix domain-containing protein [Dongia deserti]
MPVLPKKLTEAEAAEGFAALGNRARLRLLRLLVRAGGSGMTVGEIGRRMDMPASTLAHHLAALVRAGLVIQEKRGREVICTAEFRIIRGAAAYLTESCCVGFEDLDSDAAAGVA